MPCAQNVYLTTTDDTMYKATPRPTPFCVYAAENIWGKPGRILRTLIDEDKCGRLISQPHCKLATSASQALHKRLI
jgi:hypothetical protein